MDIWILIALLVFAVGIQIIYIHVSYGTDEDIKIREKLKQGEFKYYNLGKFRFFFIFYERKKGIVSRLAFWQIMTSYLFSAALIPLAVLRSLWMVDVWAVWVFIGLWCVDLSFIFIFDRCYAKLIARLFKENKTALDETRDIRQQAEESDSQDQNKTVE
jgi:hypothetical protein